MSTPTVPTAPAPTDAPPAGDPLYVIYVVERRPAEGRDLVIEAWEASPPYGWLAGYRPHDGSGTTYFGHHTDTAEDVLGTFQDVPAEIEVEAYYAGQDAPVITRVRSDEALPHDEPLLFDPDADDDELDED